MAKSVKEVFTDYALCYHNCGTVVIVEDGKANEVKGLKSHPLNQGMLCPKGRTAHQNIYGPIYSISDGDDVIIETNWSSVRMKSLVSERVAEGILLFPYDWLGEANANFLKDATCREPIMGYPEVKALL
jgi:anaerobic selenocysteine-containing dehydrogenase